MFRAARALGAGDAAIVRRHILPNILSPLIVVATTQVAGAIMAGYPSLGSAYR
jgi:peptide/nickel transport system permease protein